MTIMKTKQYNYKNKKHKRFS